MITRLRYGIEHGLTSAPTQYRLYGRRQNMITVSLSVTYEATGGLQTCLVSCEAMIDALSSN